ncbi:hypothetical protein SB659_17445 [Arthrobacter sp. SIMBA_036]|uniref:hypothetical protein n=1 Tax=Arthrobacter sp. SIMBA_036 TaxID=3085778 RepID=UPI00397BBD7E
MTLKNAARIPRPEGETLEHTRVQFEFLAQSCDAFDSGKEAEGARMATNLRVLLHQRGQSHALLGQCGVMENLWLFDSAGQYPVHDTHSPLALVGVQYEITPGKQIDRAWYIPNLGNVVRQQPNLNFQIRELLHGRKAPRGAGFHLRIDDWWKQPVMRDTAGREFSREQLVLFLANTDGGAHVDASLPEDYYALSRLNSAAVYAGMGAPKIVVSENATPTDEYTHQMALSVGAAPTEEYIRENKMTFNELGSPVPASVRQIAWELMRSVKQQFPELLPGAC